MQKKMLEPAGATIGLNAFSCHIVFDCFAKIVLSLENEKFTVLFRSN
jgi:hypothetical protein